MATTRIEHSGTPDVRMGPVALFTLLSVVCLAVLAMLAISTANATLALSQRRADATTQLYLDESAAQAFVATLEERSVAGGISEGALQEAKRAALETVPADAAAQFDVSYTSDGSLVSASFDAGNGRHLDIALHATDTGALEVVRWRMTTVVNEEPTIGNLFGSS